MSCFFLFSSSGLGTLDQQQTLLFLSHLLSIESVEEKGGGPPRCSITELLQMCWPSLTEDCVASHTTLSQQQDQVLQSLREALELPGIRLSAWEQIKAELGKETAESNEALWSRGLDSRTGLYHSFS